MSVLELYGKCKELEYCDCGGFFGCVEPAPPMDKPADRRELDRAMEADRETSDYKNHNPKYELALVDCEVCDRSMDRTIHTSPISTAMCRSTMAAWTAILER